ncbi:FAD-binding PCMH-type domain-containing protein [Mycena sanguinolenta]|uniref:FAD-binding PCMH-type domain-containing protein n=1 Tax=Mycena sanguinolenta TaxID=230812 RepID=A0A8H6ZB24_9AGAR|nr:FAD-binding PCMH-type domain-containing protein [Mycena sanguinolenta]
MSRSKFRGISTLLTLASILCPRLALALATETCTQIQQAVSSASAVYYPLDLLGNYASDISHWAASSTQESTCSVEPGSAADVSVIIQILASTNTSFAVKGGGHTANPGFSSTTGVHISMKRFSGVVYDAGSQTATIGTGLIWDDVYEALEPHGVNVVGGRVSGVGVAGFTLGGGKFELGKLVAFAGVLTFCYGLTVDTVTAFELVKPNGDIASITEASDPDLFFGLKGGQNNFGIVTQITLKTFPQGQVWGGLITYTLAQIPAVSAAVAQFVSNVTDPKAAIIPTYNFLLGQPGISHVMFYDAPTPPPGIFDAFLAIPHLTEDVSTRSFTSLVQSAPSNATTGARGAFHTVSLLDYSPTVISAILNETIFWGSHLAPFSGSFISYDIEPFLPTIFSHASTTSAYPPSRPDPAYMPLNLYFAWSDPLSDSIFHDALLQSTQQLTNVAIGEGQAVADAALYTNYALYDTPLERIYGDNVGRLKSIQAAVDPGNVMGLAGGFKF